MISASPSLFRAWRFWASSAHPREAESDSFLASAAKTKQRLAAARPARTRPCTPSHSSTIAVVSRVLRETRGYYDRKKTLTIRNTWFPDRTQIRIFPPKSNRIQFPFFLFFNELFQFKSETKEKHEQESLLNDTRSSACVLAVAGTHALGRGEGVEGLRG